MARGQESDSHRVMLEALEMRIRKLFPNAKISLGKKIKPLELKPDLFVEHPDGRKWAYEMIFGNKSAEHTLDNHQRYKEQGIHDYWVLWDSLAPSTNPLHSGQGVLQQFVEAKKRTKATKLLQAFVSIHSEHMAPGKTALYAFSLDGLNGFIEKPHRAMQVISTGMTVYQVEKIDLERKYVEYTSDFVTLMELDFDQNGCIKMNDQSDDAILQESLLKALGDEEQAHNFPLAYLKNLNQILFNLPATIPENVTKVYVERILKDATPDDLLDLQEFATSGGTAKLRDLAVPHPLSTSSTASLENASRPSLIFSTNFN